MDSNIINICYYNINLLYSYKKKKVILRVIKKVKKIEEFITKKNY